MKDNIEWMKNKSEPFYVFKDEHMAVFPESL